MACHLGAAGVALVPFVMAGLYSDEECYTSKIYLHDTTAKVT